MRSLTWPLEVTELLEEAADAVLIADAEELLASLCTE